MIDNVMLMVIAFMGVATGVYIGRHTYEELKPGEKYFLWAKSAILLAISLILLFSIKQFSLDLIFLFATGFFIAYFLRFNYLFLGISGVASIIANLQLAVLPLIFVYGLPFGTVRYYHIKNNKKLMKIILVNFILFMIPLALLLLDFDAQLLAAFSAGALLANIR